MTRTENNTLFGVATLFKSQLFPPASDAKKDSQQQEIEQYYATIEQALHKLPNVVEVRYE